MSEPTDTGACGCCAGVRAATPQPIHNRPALPQVAYRIGTWADFRASLVAGLSSARRPALAKLLTRDGDDFTLGLVDAFACVADVLTFYQERLANECWLRTATERVSLQELGRLVGHRLRPGLAAETWLAFTLETPPQPPAGAGAEPGSFVTGVPSRVALPARLQVRSVPGPGEQPQVFETVEALAEARPEWNAVRPWLDAVRVPRAGDTALYLAGTRTGLRTGDAVVLAVEAFFADPAAAGNRWDFRIVSAVHADAANERTRIEFARPLAAINPPGATPSMPRLLTLRKRAAVFGHNAPLWAGMPNAFKDAYPGGKVGDDYVAEWPAFTASARAPTGSTAWVDLDAVVPEVAAGGVAVVARGDFNHPAGGGAGTAVGLYAVRATGEVSRAAFALSAKVTRLELVGRDFASAFHAFPRELTVFAASEPLAPAPVPVDDAVAGDALPLAVAGDGLRPGRRLVVRGTTAAGAPLVHQATVRAVTTHGEARCTLAIDPPLPAALVRTSVVVHLNVAPASHGQTVTQILGSGDAAAPFARFELQSAPLTYRAAAGETGAAAELEVRVGDVRWQERPTLYGADAAERAYAVERDVDDRAWIRFGDGLRGARVPTGVHNVRATYRTGLGAAGNVGAETLTQLVTRPLGLKGVANPAPAEGGADPESAADARASLPLVTRTLGRVVSLQDYEDFARAFAGIAKARADVLALRGGRTVVITIAAPAGAAIGPASPLWHRLRQALLDAGDPLVPVRLIAARLSTFRLGLRVRCDPAHEAPAVLAAVEAALRAAYAFDARALAEQVRLSEVIAVAHQVAGVQAVDVDWLYGGSEPAVQTTPSLQSRLLASRARVAPDGSVRPAELLTLDAGPLASLEEMP